MPREARLDPATSVPAWVTRGGSLCRTAIVAAMLLPWAVPVRAAAPVAEPEADFVRTSWTVQDGLPVNSVTDLIQTRDGYLWIATFDGLVRFDGQQFTVFNQSNAPDLPSNRILSLKEGADGSIWIKTQSSEVVRMTDPVGGWTVYDTGEVPEVVNTMHVGHDGTVWLGTEFGLSRIESGRIVPYRRDRLSGHVGGLYRDRAGRFWTYSHPVLRVLDADALSVFRVEANGPDRIRAFYELQDGRVLIGGANGLFERDGDRLREVDWTSLRDDIPVVGSEESAREGPITVPLLRHLYQPAGGRPPRAGGTHPWASTADGQPWRTESARLYQGDRQVADLGVGASAVLVDREGSVWVGTGGAGLHRFTRGALSPVLPRTADGAVLNVYSMFEGRDGSIWFASFGNGVGMLRGETVEGFGGGRSARLAQTVIERSDGRILVGGWAGLHEYRDGGLRPVADGPIGDAHEVYLLHEDRDGWLWVGTQLGLFRERRGEWNAYGVADGLGSSWVRTCLERRGGELWFGTSGGGIAIWRNGRLEALRADQGLPARAVRGMYEDANGIVWAATEGVGLARIDLPEGRPAADARVTMIRARDGLYDDTLHAILEDDRGFLWISTNRGLFSVRRAALDAFAAGRAERLFCTSFTEADGMRNRECNGQANHSAIRTRDGRLWFATQEGAVVLDPALAHRNLPPPPVVIEEALARDLRFSGRGSVVRLPANRRDFTIQYTGLSLRTPQDLRFRYRLIGLDRGWNEVGNRRSAIYTHVPPGTYTFEVAASLRDDDWPRDAARMTIVVAPYFYETWWFKALVAVLVLAAAYAAMRLRVRGLERRQRDLAEQVAARTRDLVAQQAQTEYARAEAEEARDTAQRSLDTIEAQAADLRELNEARSRFFANVSHEFRTPLTLTIGPIEDLLAGLHGPLRDDAAEQLQLALRSSHRVLRQVNQLLDLARAESGGMRLRARPIDLPGLAAEAVRAFEPAATRHGIALEASLSHDSREVCADPALIEQVIANLVSNAIRHTPEGGRVRVTVGFDSADVQPPFARIAVTDTGAGIGAEDRERVFERFFQAGDGGAGGSRGTGIGLSLTREILELHGGGIAVESEVGAGSTFTAWIPIGRAHLADEQIAGADEGGRHVKPLAPWLMADVPPQRDGDDSRVPDGAPFANGSTPGAGGDRADTDDRTTVLLVEDDLEVRAYLRRHLGASYRVVEAADGEAGLAAARNEIPDLVVSDVMMPRMDGLELCAAIKRHPETEFVPVILLTAKATVEHRIEGLDLGADDYLGKPFHARELMARVRNLIALRHRLRERLAPRGLRAERVPATSSDDAFLERVRAVIEERLGDESFNVQTLAQAAGMDRTHLYRRLQALTGAGPEEAIRRMRLERAAQLLEERVGSVGEIAYAVGFKSVSHFCKSFRERYGKTPGTFAVRAEVPRGG